MTWTYSAAPRSDVDRIRLLVGDTDATDQQVQDEEIQTFLALEGNTSWWTVTSTRPVLYRAASSTARAIAAHYARQVTITSGKVKDENEVLLAHYRTLAEDLWKRASSVGVGPRVGGIAVSDKISSQQNTSLVQPFFARDMETEPGTGAGDSLMGEVEALEFSP